MQQMKAMFACSLHSSLHCIGACIGKRLAQGSLEGAAIHRSEQTSNLSFGRASWHPKLN